MSEEQAEQIEQTPNTYNEITKGYIYKWRENHPDRYNEYHRKYYAIKKEDPEWRLKHNERCKEYNRKHKEKKRGGLPPRPRGRPKKATDFISMLEETLMNDDVDISDEIVYLEN
tara:strand:- start:4072 stop:4413 length:342 start_codon:yes stop_codon:yes gene_type:complete